MTETRSRASRWSPGRVAVIVGLAAICVAVAASSVVGLIYYYAFSANGSQSSEDLATALDAVTVAAGVGLATYLGVAIVGIGRLLPAGERSTPGLALLLVPAVAFAMVWPQL